MKNNFIILILVILYSCDNNNSKELLSENRLINTIDSTITIDILDNYYPDSLDSYVDSVDGTKVIIDSTGVKKYKNGKLVKYDKNYFNYSGTLDSFKVNIENHFKKDRLQIYFDSILVFDDTITWVNTETGAAKYFNLCKNRTMDSIGIKLNDYKIIKNKWNKIYNDFDQILIDKFGAEFKITLTNRVIWYI